MHKQTFLLLHPPGWWLRGRRYAHIIFGVDTEAIFPSEHDVAHCELVIEESLSHCGPCPFGGVQFGDRVVEAVIPLLVRGRLPGHSDRAGHVFLQLYRSRRLRIICDYSLSGWSEHKIWRKQPFSQISVLPVTRTSVLNVSCPARFFTKME